MTKKPSTRAAVPKKDSELRAGFLPNLPDIPQASNLQASDVVPMTFNMPKPWHTEFKMTAVARGISMKELLFESFDAYKREQKREGGR